ncbi:cellulose biosynthesis cyclic di-GMP-binding regulatory protein BcsB [Mucilaginibacter sp. Bleaf8]|uniref:cellulose biosynthesis cyclic di-GMP-binding regulatory protein BcsB n=1 Tax=Mucilaginibacter sp. Bleaf8 TaxID=2834430 RepID=UPI001BCD06EA|nr:cellulose biosynthesis cyclic di-GMP-binding regulatory protein BcsB [Mucilaginibacter sp. Bleaf8]MBS7566980.1 cellulose biosynthesis cyclic di-GMP-binding regulatory protein BcsB [Mucilaginibacter sp. Bleaf8]
MNKLLTRLILFTMLLAGRTALAQTTNISFKTLGHDDDVIYGMSGATSFYFKIDPLVNVNNSKVVIYYEPSQALIKDLSYVNILIGDKPVYSGRLTRDSIQKLVLPLSSSYLTENRQYLKIQVKTLLTITDNKCKDLDNPAMWLKVKGYSYLALAQGSRAAYKNVSISNSFDTKTAIVYPTRTGLNDLKAIAWAYSRIKKSVATGNIRVYPADRVPDSVKNYVMVGDIDALPADKRRLISVTPQEGQGLLYLYKGPMATDTTAAMQYRSAATPNAARQAFASNEILFVTGADDSGYEKAVAALANPNVINTAYGDYLVVNVAATELAKGIEQNRSRLTFRQIGGVNNFLSGIGSLRSLYNFRNSDFSFTPKEVEIKFVGTYSGLNAGDRGFFNVYLNGMLISSEKLNASGKLNTSVVINRYQHRKYNALTTEFRFYPNSGNCQNAFTNFFSEIDVDRSYLESKNPIANNTLSFYQYPEAFTSGSTRIVVSKNYTKYAASAIGEILYELNNNIASNNFPQFSYSDEVNDNDLKNSHIIALLSKDDMLMNKFPDAPIKFNHSFRLYNNADNKTVYSLSDSVSNGLAQIFYGRSNNAVLILTATGSHVGDAFLSASRAITEQLSTLNSNVCIADINNNKYLFNINKTGDNLEYTDGKSGLAQFWENYNLFVLLGVLVLILLAFLYVRNKVQKSQEIINE